MEALIRTRKIGGSLLVTIPKELVREENIVEGDLVKIDIEKIRKSGFGMLKGIGPFTKEDKFKGQLEENE